MSTGSATIKQTSVEFVGTQRAIIVGVSCRGLPEPPMRRKLRGFDDRAALTSDRFARLSIIPAVFRHAPVSSLVLALLTRARFQCVCVYNIYIYIYVQARRRAVHAGLRRGRREVGVGAPGPFIQIVNQSLYIHIYIYIYRERERCIYTYVYTQCLYTIIDVR